MAKRGVEFRLRDRSSAWSARCPEPKVPRGAANTSSKIRAARFMFPTTVRSLFIWNGKVRKGPTIWKASGRLRKERSPRCRISITTPNRRGSALIGPSHSRKRLVPGCGVLRRGLTANSPPLTLFRSCYRLGPRARSRPAAFSLRQKFINALCRRRSPLRRWAKAGRTYQRLPALLWRHTPC